MGWQLIETAPKSRDTLVDLWIITPASSRNGNQGYARRFTDCYWAGGGFAWCYAGSAVTGQYYTDWEGDECFDPLSTGPGAIIATHWMPLPKPPESV